MSNTIVLIVIIVIVVFVSLVYISNCGAFVETFLRHRCALYDEYGIQCQDLSQFECNRCKECKWLYSGGMRGGQCIHLNQWPSFYKGRAVYFGIPGRIPPSPPVRNWWGTRPSIIRSHNNRMNWRFRNKRNNRIRRLYKTDTWGRPIHVL